MKRAEIEAIARGISSAMREHLDAELRTIRREMDEVRATSLSYGGTWNDSANYRRNVLVTHSGALWIAREETTDRPGTSSAWKMMHKTPNR